MRHNYCAHCDTYFPTTFQYFTHECPGNAPEPLVTTHSDAAEPLYRICWRALLSDATGEGTGLFTEEEARRIVADLNRQNVGVTHHWFTLANDGWDWAATLSEIATLTDFAGLDY